MYLFNFSFLSFLIWVSLVVVVVQREMWEAEKKMILMEIKFSCIYMFSIGLAPGTRANWTIWIFRQWDVLGAAIYSHTHTQGSVYSMQHTVTSWKTVLQFVRSLACSRSVAVTVSFGLSFPRKEHDTFRWCTRFLVCSLHTARNGWWCVCVCFGSKCVPFDAEH